MQFTVFDIETTGLSPQFDDIIQFSCITVNERMLPIRGQNYYLYKEGMNWSSQAEAVHGLSRDFLKQYTDEYEHNILLMYTILQRANLVGHNSNAFDVPFVKQFLTRQGLPGVRENLLYDTMKLWRAPFGKKMKLANLPSALGIEEERIARLAKLIFGEEASEVEQHNAMYDTTATLLCFQEAIKKGLCSL